MDKILTVHWSGNLGEHHTVLLPPAVAGVLFFTDIMVVILLVFKVSTNLHRGDGLGQVEMPQSSLFLPSQPYFLNKHFLSFCKTSFQSSKRVYFEKIYQYYICLWKSGFLQVLTLLFLKSLPLEFIFVESDR